MINTVLGSIAPDRLGKTLVHEHICCQSPGFVPDDLTGATEKNLLKLIIAEFRALKELGVESAVDATPVDLGRNLDYQKTVSEESGVNIVAATGLYREGFGLTVPYRSMSLNEMADFMLTELTKGINGSDTKAGVIKVASSDSVITATEERALRAAALAQRESGTPLLTHTSGRVGLKQIEILKDSGANLNHVCIGHSDCNSNPEYHLKLTGAGVFVGFDRIGLEVFNPDAVRIENLKKLVNAGFEKQVLISQDVVGIFRGINNRTFSLPERSYLHLFIGFLPRLIGTGLRTEIIDTLFIENTGRFFKPHTA